MTLIYRVITTTALLLLALTALAADDRPAPPQEVFKYVVFDSGDALEIDWAVEDGAYMYRDNFAFAVDDPTVVLGAVEFPDGEVHDDEYFGEQVVFRDSFFVRIPYTINGDKPTSLALTIDSRGCLDSGYCYMPQTWVETVELKQPQTDGGQMSFGDMAPTTPSDSEFPPVDEVFFPEVFTVDR
jgi:thiol:disulfide interchange protein DsbD